jgi:hypothetical protein
MSGLATAIIGSAVVGAAVSSRSASKAAKAQQEASGASIDEQRAQFEAMQRTLKPYVDAGTPALRQIASYSDIAQPALNEQQALIGMFGAEAQQQAINRIEQSPLYLEQVRQGENAILQQASATGGLRGGNIQAALAQFRPAVLSQMIENQYTKLGGMAEFGGQAAQNLATMGQASGAGVGAAGMGMASNIGNALQATGTAQAQAQLAKGQAWGNVTGAVSGLAGLGMQGVGPFARTPTAAFNPNAAGYVTVPGAPGAVLPG